MNTTTIQILLIEDNPGDVRLLKETLTDSSIQSFNITHADRLKSGLELLAREPIDLVLLDLNLPDSQGLETLKTLMTQAIQIPVVVMSGLEDMALAVEAVQLGAQDFMVKRMCSGNLISRILNSAMERKRLILDLQKSESRKSTIIENNADGVLIVDYEEVIRFVNPSGLALLGLTSEQLVGTKFAYPIQTEKSNETEIMRPDGSKRLVELRTNAMTWDDHPANLVSLRDITEQVSQREDMRNQSFLDSLTGLYNRRGFLAVAGFQVKQLHRAGQCAGIFYLDLDGLKQINDIYGHAVGDQALQLTAALLKGAFRETDIIARLGGDEFVILAVDADKDGSERLITRLEKDILAFNQSKEQPFQLSISIGVSHFVPQQPATLKELLELADIEMYKQKASKKQLNNAN